jgi:2-keto-3-deoxy-L-rhamnonate aldolase RhmA
VCLVLEEVEAIDNLPELVMVPGVDVCFIGSGDPSQSMGYTEQPTNPDVQNTMERGVKTITSAGRIAGCSCPDNLIPKFLGLGVQYFHGTVGRLLQESGETYLQKVRQAAADTRKGPAARFCASSIPIRTTSRTHDSLTSCPRRVLQTFP